MSKNQANYKSHNNLLDKSTGDQGIVNLSYENTSKANNVVTKA